MRPVAGTLARCLGALLAAIVPLGAAHSDNNVVPLALDYCSNHQHTVKLKEDFSVLCFDTEIPQDLYWDNFHKLKNNAVFVIRSMGGDGISAMKAADILLEKHATVVVYDYCLSACAAAFFVASKETFVAKNTIVAWHSVPWWPQGVECDASSWFSINDDGYTRRRKEGIHLYCRYAKFINSFFARRNMDDRIARSPQTLYTKKMLDLILKERSDKSSVFWMWHPKNHKDFFKLKITYESYPESQEKVNEIIRRVRFPRRISSRVIYDPEE
jgi:hypothetical protein